MTALHHSRATTIFVVDCCQFGPSWIFGLKMELMACADLVGGTTEQRCIFPDLIWYYQWYEIHLKLYASQLSLATSIFVVDCCKFGPSRIFGLKMELMPCAGLVGGTIEHDCIFSWPYMLVSMIWNTSKLSALHLIRATAIFVVDCCQFGPSYIFGLKMELMACAGLVGGTTEQSCIFPDLIW